MSRATREANAEILRQRDDLLHAVERVVENARQRNAIDDVAGLPTDYVSSVDMLIVQLEAVQIASPGANSLAKERIRELEAKNAALQAKVDEASTTATELAPAPIPHLVGFDLATGRSVHSVPRQAGKFLHTYVVPQKTEAEIRDEVLTKVILALQLDTYGYHDPSSPQSTAALLLLGRHGHPKPDPKGFWADIESTLADREDDAEYARVEAARKRIEGLTARPVDAPEDGGFDLAGEDLADAA